MRTPPNDPKQKAEQGYSAFEYGQRLRVRDDLLDKIFKHKPRDPLAELLAGYRRGNFDVLTSITFGISELLARLLPASIPVPRRRWLLAGAVSTMATAAAAYSSSVPILDRLEENLACAERIPVTDAKGFPLGWTRPKPCPSRNRFRYRSARVTPKTAARLANAVEVLEGPLTGPLVLYNIDFAGLARVPYYLFKGEAVGGTGAVQSVFEIAAGAPGKMSGQILQKARYLIAGLIYSIEHLGTFETRAQFVADHLQCAAGYPKSGVGVGGVLAGDFCAAVVGKATLAELNDGEFCYLAATAKHQFKALGSTPTAEQLEGFAQTIDKVKQRAVTCARRLANNNEAAFARYRSEIDAIKFPEPGEMDNVDTQLADALPGASQVLHDTGASGAERLTLWANAQRKLAAQSNHYLSKIVEPNLDRRLCRSACDDNRQVDFAVLVVEVEKTGGLPIRAAVQTRARLLTGPKVGRPSRSQGSAAKALLVPLLTEAGITRLCSEKWASLHDSDGYAGGSCTQVLNWLTLEEATARSSNLAFAWGLRQIDPSTLRGYLRFLGFWFDESLDNNQLIRSAITGDAVTITPVTLLRDEVALAFSSRSVGVPVLNKPTPGNGEFAISSVISLAGLARAKSAWVAPVESSFGTARAAHKILSEAGCQLKLAKTGTSDSIVPRAFRDKVITIVANCNARDFAVYAMVGSPDPKIPVGRLRSSDLVSLAARALVQTSSER